MRIGIDARKIRDFGIGTHIRNLIAHLPEFDRDNEYFIFHYPADRAAVPQTGANITLVPDASPKYSLRELAALPVKMRRLRLDLFHAPHYTLPPIRPCKGIVTIHDVIHLRFPAYLPHPAAYYYAKGMMWAAARSAQKVITVSECSKQDLMRYLGLPAAKIVVVYNGIEVAVNECHCEESATKQSRDTCEIASQSLAMTTPFSENLTALPQNLSSLGLGEGAQHFDFSRPYILYVGNFLPHKNLATLVKAYGLLKRQHKLEHGLVLAGKNERLRASLEHLIATEKLEPDVILTGFVEPAWLPALYAQAALFVYPSLYEGFGLQALEAMAAQIPVAISNVSALPEIAGDAAIQFDPKSVESMADAMYQALTDPALRATLIAKGTRRVKRFSWQEMARQTVEIYQSVLTP